MKENAEYMITTHQYLDTYPIDADSEKLIVGTIHPHNHMKFNMPFFYGNVKSIWMLLSEAFPHDLGRPLTLEGILRFLRKRKMSMSDTIRTCKRQTSTALDQDLIPIELNTQMIGDIKQSCIKEIFFTSGFQKTSAFKLFYVDILKKRITQDIRNNRGVRLEQNVFGRPVTLTILYSPSGASNVGIARSKLYQDRQERYIHSRCPIHDFKVDYYYEKFR